LEWLLGEWTGKTKEGVILVSSHWSDGGNYIVREFAYASPGRETISGTQRIGWNAAEGKIECWSFDSQGGTGEGSWRRDGERWIVTTRELSAEGRMSKTTAVYLPGEERFVMEIASVWEAAVAEERGEKLPALRVEFQRAREG
jgi:hypothetical protein